MTTLPIYRYEYAEPISYTPVYNAAPDKILVPFTGGNCEYTVLSIQAYGTDSIFVCADMLSTQTMPRVGGATGSDKQYYRGYLAFGAYPVSLHTPAWSHVKNFVGVIASGGASTDPGLVILQFRQRIALESHLLTQEQEPDTQTRVPEKLNSLQSGQPSIIRRP